MGRGSYGIIDVFRCRKKRFRLPRVVSLLLSSLTSSLTQPHKSCLGLDEGLESFIDREIENRKDALDQASSPRMVLSKAL